MEAVGIIVALCFAFLWGFRRGWTKKLPGGTER